MKNSFFLVIPKQQKNSQRVRDFEEAALSNWIVELPAANMGLATRLMHDLFVDFNAVEMSSQLRLNALEQLRPSFLMIEDYLRSRLIRTGFPKEENDQKIFAVLVAIEREFAIGYWIVLKELTHRTVGWFQGKNTALTLQRCIKSLSGIVVSHFIMGLSVSDWVWMDLHSLYKLSVKTEKNTIKVANDIHQTNKLSSPEDCYLQTLLLSLVEPTGLMQKEILLVDSFIETISSLVSLKSSPVYGLPVQCLVFTDEDKPPAYQAGSAHRKDSSILYIDFSRLQKLFEHKEKLIDINDDRFIAVQMQKNTNGKLTAELLDYLEQRWAGVGFEGEPLFSDRLDRYIAIGLVATLLLQDTTSIEDKNDLEFLAQSESERSLSCSFNQTGILSVGSLVSFRKTNTPEHIRSLGVVDKLVVAKQKIIFSMKLLATEISSIDYSPPERLSTKPSGNHSSKNNSPPPAEEELKRALYYSVHNHDEYIVTDLFVLKDDDVIKLHFHNESISVALKNRSNIALGYWQFECVRVKEKKKHTSTHRKGYDFI